MASYTDNLKLIMTGESSQLISELNKVMGLGSKLGKLTSSLGLTKSPMLEDLKKQFGKIDPDVLKLFNQQYDTSLKKSEEMKRKIIDESSEYTKLGKEISRSLSEGNRFASLGSQMGKLDAVTGTVSDGFRKMEMQLGKNSAAFKIFNSNYQTSIKRANEMKTRFDMNILSWVFGGMAMQRMGLQIIRFLVPSMEKLTKLNDAASKKIIGVAAAFEFLKISLFETLMSLPLFEEFIAMLVKGAIWAADFAQQHPKLLGILAVVGGIMAVLGTLALGVGIFEQISHMGTLLIVMGRHVYVLGAKLLALAIANPLITGLAIVAGLIAYTILKTPKLREGLMMLYDEGVKTPLSQLLTNFLSLFGLNIDLDRALKLVAATWIWMMEIPLMGFVKLIGLFNDVINGIKLIIEGVKMLGDLFKGFWVVVSGEDTAGLTKAWDSIQSRYNTWKEGTVEGNKVIDDSFSALWESFKKGPQQFMETTPFSGGSSGGRGVTGTWEEGTSVGTELEQLTDVGSTVNAELSSIFNAAKSSVQDLNKEITPINEVLTDMSDTTMKDWQKAVDEAIGSVKDNTGAIGSFNSLGTQINIDKDYFNTLKTDVDTWAAKETVKIIKIKYVYENAGADSFGGFSSMYSGSLT